MNNMMSGMNMGGLGDKMMNRFFRKVDNVVWDLFTGKIGVQTADGITTIEGAGDEAEIQLNLMDQFGMPVPAFAQSTPITAVAVGDLIYADNKAKGWVVAVNEKSGTLAKPATDDAPAVAAKPASKSFTLMSPSGTTVNWKPPKVAMLGFDSGVMVLRSLMNMLPGGEGGLSNMQSMLMPMMMMGGDMDMDKMMPMMLFSQLGASGTGTDAAGGGMMQTMMMMQMMGGMGGKGKSGGNFFDQ